MKKKNLFNDISRKRSHGSKVY